MDSQWTARAREVEKTLDLEDSDDGQEARQEILLALAAEAYQAGHAAGVAECIAKIEAFPKSLKPVNGGIADIVANGVATHWAQQIAAALRAGRGENP